MEGGLGTPTSSAGSSTCKRLQQPRRPGYLRTELPRLQGTLAGEEGRTAWLTYGASGCHGMNKQNGHSDVIKTINTLRLPVPAGSCVSVSQQLSPLETYSSEAYKPSLSYQNNHLISSSPTPPLLCSSPPPLSQEEGCCVTKCSSPSPQSDFRLTPGSIPLQPCLLSPNPRPRSPNPRTRSPNPRSPNPRSPNPRSPNPRSPNPNSRTCPSGSTGSRSPQSPQPTCPSRSPQSSQPTCPSRSPQSSQPTCSSRSPQSPQPTCPSRSPPSGDTPFSSSFSFIQQSLSLYSLGSSHSTDPQPLNSSTSLDPNPLDQSSARSLRTGSVPSHSEPLERSGSVPPCQSRPVSASLDQLPSRTSGSSSNQSGLGVLDLSLGLSVSKLSTPSRVQSEPGSVPLSQSDRGRDRLSPWVWQDRHWEAREGAGPSLGAELPSSVTSDLAELEPDCDSSSLDTEAVSSSLSVGEDSDAASASSLTSGYESATPTTATPGPAHNCTPGPAHNCTPDQDQGWDQVVKKYEGVLQDCLHNNRTNTKIQSMMLKLQRLQQKAILEDEYDSAERFGKKLEELRRERSSLRLTLPSRQPTVALFLQRLRKAVHSALTRMDDHRDEVESDGKEGAETVQGPLQRRERLLQEKRVVEAEMAELQWRLGELQSRSCSLEHQIQQEEEELQTEAVEGPALRSCSHTQLRDMGHALDDLVTSQNRTRICVSTPEGILRLQEQEQTLSLSIKDATAKVVMSQRLGGSLTRKLSETETQLLALHEAKLAAISGNDFSSAKELKVEMRAVYGERERLELLVKRFHSLSFGNSQDLAKMKTQLQQLKQELGTRQAQHEWTLKENAVKYIELLEDRLQSCGCPPLERIWEADLEACHLLLQGLQLCTPFCSGPDPATVVLPNTQPATKQEADLQECAMLTALGGCWCPEANLQNSEFTKKLEEFLFCVEDVHPEEEDSEATALTADLTMELTDQCEEISDRLLILEDDLQTAIQNRDQALTQSLEQEVREVKDTLHTMLTQLNEEEEEEEEEDQYFSDSWEI